MLNPKQPLWLPQGSVRAILALVLVIAVVGLSFAALVDPEKLVELAVMVIAFYFGAKASQAPVK